MPSVFPLFDTLYQDTESIQTALTYDEKMELCNDMKKLDQEGYDLLYAIIRTFYLEKENGHFDFVPYSPKINKSGYKFDATFFPPRLLIIMRHFVTLHRQKILEEERLQHFMSTQQV